MEDSDSDSTPSLHNIDWSSTQSFFDYEDPSSLSPQIWAVIGDDVPRLKTLLEAGKSLNVNNNAGDTPLHVAVRKNKKQAFNFLIKVPHVRIDATNFKGATPLLLALDGLQEYYAIKLMEKGANVNLARDTTGYTPLHYSIGLNVEVANTMLKMGAKIDAQTCTGATPLLLACGENKSDLIHLLLLKGADPTIPDDRQMLPVTLSIFTCSEDLQEILFDYTFEDGRNEVSLFTLIATMMSKPQFFYKLVDTNCEVFYKQSDFQKLEARLYEIEPEIFRVFLNKFQSVAREFFRFYNPFKCRECHHLGSTKLNVNFINFLYFLCETDFIGAIAEQSAQNCLTHTLICQRLPEDTLTKVLFSLLSHGVDLTSYDLSMVYKHYGFGDLFKLLLHMDIVKRGASIMPQLIYDLSFNVGNIATIAGSVVDSQIFELSKFFKVVHRGISVEPPSLVELARNSARDFIIKKYKMRNNIHFFTVLKWLPINHIYKQILSFEKKIYP